jgi:endonuclease/exonuclease/phosphatase family metal-dependent hydrolase
MLLEQFAALMPDVIAVQEIFVPGAQGQWIVDRVNEHLGDNTSPYVVHQAAKTGASARWEAIGVMTRLAIVATESIDLRGGDRVAMRVRLRAPRGGDFDVYNTHLHNGAAAADLRLEQARTLLAWMAERGDVPAMLAGDLNATPEQPPVAALRERLRSAYSLVHGREPEGTVPAPLNAEWAVEPPKVLDYIFVDRSVRVHDARVVFDGRSPTDVRLSASDHYGLVADVSFEVGETKRGRPP